MNRTPDLHRMGFGGDNPTKGKLISGALIRQLASEAARGRTEAA